MRHKVIPTHSFNAGLGIQKTCHKASIMNVCDFGRIRNLHSNSLSFLIFSDIRPVLNKETRESDYGLINQKI
jgi:hypothetical protein